LLLGQRIIEIWHKPSLSFHRHHHCLAHSALAVILVLVIAPSHGCSPPSTCARPAYREKARDYVAAARLLGAGPRRVIFRHVIPNAIATIVTLAPFLAASVITNLAALDFLGFGLPPEDPSWGRLLHEGADNFNYPWIVSAAFVALASCLILITLSAKPCARPSTRKIYDIPMNWKSRIHSSLESGRDYAGSRSKAVPALSWQRAIAFRQGRDGLATGFSRLHAQALRIRYQTRSRTAGRSRHRLLRCDRPRMAPRFDKRRLFPGDCHLLLALCPRLHADDDRFPPTIALRNIRPSSSRCPGSSFVRESGNFPPGCNGNREPTSPNSAPPMRRKGGTFHYWIDSFPATFRFIGPDANDQFRSEHWDDIMVYNVMRIPMWTAGALALQ
jgi:hypothetical protein